MTGLRRGSACLIALLVCLSLLPAVISPTAAQSVPDNPDGANSSGGQGLGAPPASAPAPQGCEVTVTAAVGLRNLSPGTTACIPGGATINMPMGDGTTLPEGTRLLSNGGTLAYRGSPRTDTFSAEHMLNVESNVVIRGVNIVGPIAGRTEPGSPDEFGGRNKNAIMIGVGVTGQNVQLQRLTVRGWPAANIRFEEQGTGRISYSQIVGAYTSDRGYGVSGVGQSSFVVSSSYFNRNRHSVEAGDEASYTVADSVIGPDHSSHSLDVHPPAGGRYVYRNLTVESESGLTMRQVPDNGSVVQNVWFTRAGPEQAIEQINQRRVDNPSDSRTHVGGKIADGANGFEDFRGMDIRNVYFGEAAPPGAGAPNNLPAPRALPGIPEGGGGGFGWFLSPAQIKDAAMGAAIGVAGPFAAGVYFLIALLFTGITVFCAVLLVLRWGANTKRIK